MSGSGTEALAQLMIGHCMGNYDSVLTTEPTDDCRRCGVRSGSALSVQVGCAHKMSHRATIHCLEIIVWAEILGEYMALFRWPRFYPTTYLVLAS